jgi:hypothetical protein
MGEIQGLKRVINREVKATVTEYVLESSFEGVSNKHSQWISRVIIWPCLPVIHQ